MNKPFADLRSFLEFLDAGQRLLRIPGEVDKDTELACVARWIIEGNTHPSRAKALLFERIRGHTSPVAVNLFGTLDNYADALGAKASEVLNRWAEALQSPFLPRTVSSAPVHSIVQREAEIDLRQLPVPIWTPGKDTTPYFSAALVITKDPETGIQNLASYRIQLQGPRDLGLFFGSALQHGAIHLGKYQARGERMPVALVVGAPPAVAFAAAAKTAYGVDELTIAGGLQTESIEVVRCETSDLLVPARAEMVIEGWVDPTLRRPEGPFGEALGYMNEAAPAPGIQVVRVCQRHNSIHHGYVQQLPPTEGHLVMEMGILGPLWFYLTRRLGLAGISDLAVAPGSAGVATLVVQIKSTHRAETRRIAQTLAQLQFGQRFIWLVDEDIDIRDPVTLNWALSSRVDPVRDIITRDGVKTFQLDPSVIHRASLLGEDTAAAPYKTSLAIIDATLKGPAPLSSLPTRAAMAAVREVWPQFGIPEPLPSPRLERILAHNDAVSERR